MKTDSQTAPDRPSEATETVVPEQWRRAQEASPCSPAGPVNLPQDDPGKPSITDIIERIRAKSKASEPLEKARLAFPSPAPVFSKSLENTDKPSKRRSSVSGVPTKRLHNDACDDNADAALYRYTDLRLADASLLGQAG